MLLVLLLLTRAQAADAARSRELQRKQQMLP
jgi:hypothetical protein